MQGLYCLVPLCATYLDFEVLGSCLWLSLLVTGLVATEFAIVGDDQLSLPVLNVRRLMCWLGCIYVLYVICKAHSIVSMLRALPEEVASSCLAGCSSMCGKLFLEVMMVMTGQGNRTVISRYSRNCSCLFAASAQH